MQRNSGVDRRSKVDLSRFLTCLRLEIGIYLRVRECQEPPSSFPGAMRMEAGSDGFHVHQMRDTFACQWTASGGSLATLQLILGHASIETMQRYARLSDEAVMREAARLVAPSRSPHVVVEVL